MLSEFLLEKRKYLSALVLTCWKYWAPDPFEFFNCEFSISYSNLKSSCYSKYVTTLLFVCVSNQTHRELQTQSNTFPTWSLLHHVCFLFISLMENSRIRSIKPHKVFVRDFSGELWCNLWGRFWRKGKGRIPVRFYGYQNRKWVPRIGKK